MNQTPLQLFQAAFPVIVEQQVAWGDMDSYLHVNNVVYFRYFENARLEYIRRLGWLDLEKKFGIGPILQATQARFRKPLTYPDTIYTGARLGALEEDRFTLEHRIFSLEKQDWATEGQGTLVCFDYRQGKKTPIPAELRQKIMDLEGKVQ